MPLPSHVPASQPRRSAQSHAAILRAAADLAGRVGYAAASIEQIAEEAKVGKQTIYRWWPNKAALFIEVYRDLAPINLLAKDTGSLGGDLELLLTQLSRLYSTTPAGNILSGLIAEAQTAGELADQMRETYVVPRRAIVESIFARAAARGEIAPLRDPDLVSDLISGAVWFRLLLGKQQLDRKFKSHLIEMIQHGLADMPAGAAPGLHQRRRKREHRH
ncbi:MULTISPECIES: TetR/AcrR family transcriptional regulator [unclassified Bradyrhizobium]|uniref:TetR/AcrR family transcriptional regulator n=1 Tax=unclassified Bradyrhizobium TaxID=2631580 RepID=UPI0028EF0210|nr:MULTISPECIES: TetR/AcrR family transcriptional regulator [unclassified Bradyrhizobium]